MHQKGLLVKFFIVFTILLLVNSVTKAQLNAADSLLFAQIFNQQKYADDSAFPGNWYVNDTIQSAAELQTALDSAFKFKLHDFDYLHTMTVVDTLYYDSLRNNTYNSYPQLYKQNDPLVNIKFSLNGKRGISHAFLFPSDTPSQANTAHLILPGSGNNPTSPMVQGTGYHNLLCFLSHHLKLHGDVYAYIKPNEEARAIYWNQNKLNNSYMVSYLDTSMHHPYGLNYLLEIVATIKFLKNKYCKVIVYGLSEGGYAGLLSSLIEKPTAAMISAGYAIGFDNPGQSNTILRSRFDSLVFRFHKDTIKTIIESGITQYMFTWGNDDATKLMQAEHDSNYTQKFLNNIPNCSFYYNYQKHTFPHCEMIDTFTLSMESQPDLRYYMVNFSNDSMITRVTNCDTIPYEFDLFLNNSAYQHYSNISSDFTIVLTDSGMYRIRNVINNNNITTSCPDSVYFNKKTIIPSPTNKLLFQFNNPVRDILHITRTDTKPSKYFYSIIDMPGNEKVRIQSENQTVLMDLHSQPIGMYFLKVWNETQSFAFKLIKQ